MDFKARFVEEVRDLKVKIEKLSKFVPSGDFDDLDDEDCMLLEMQRRAMMMYMDVLVMRGEKLGLGEQLAELFSE